MEIVLGFRLRQALDCELELQAVNEEAWAKSYSRLALAPALNAFRGARAWNLALIETFDESDFRRTMKHPKHGVQNVGNMLKIFAGHDLNHIEQLENINMYPLK
jgi:DinB superfamily